MTTVHAVQRCLKSLVILLFAVPLAAAQDQVLDPPEQRRRGQSAHH